MSIGRTATRWAPVTIGLLLMGFGVACFNYTKPGALQYHQEWAAANGRPAPTDTIFWCGVGGGGRVCRWVWDRQEGRQINPPIADGQVDGKVRAITRTGHRQQRQSARASGTSARYTGRARRSSE